MPHTLGFEEVEDLPSPSSASLTIAAVSRHSDELLLGASSATSELDDADAFIAGTPPPPKKRQTHARAIAVRAPGLAFPKSLYDGENDLRVRLEEYSIYRRHKLLARDFDHRRPRELPLANHLVALNEINERSIDYLLFDGNVCFGGQRHYVKGLPFELLSIGQYQAPEVATVGDQVWIQSFEGRKHDIWYHLGKPSLEYEPFHQAFSWIADLSKHVIDYLHLHDHVDLEHFRYRFSQWLRNMYQHDTNYAQWIKKYQRLDFRHAVVAHANFLYCQTAQVDRRLIKQLLWLEIDPRNLRALPEQIEKKITQDMIIEINIGKNVILHRKTTVTPYVQDCFKIMPWAAFLHCGTPGLFTCTSEKMATDFGSTKALQRPIGIGDVVAIESDGDCLWKTDDKEYFAYVQDIKVTSEGRSLDLLWLYRPWDTACKKLLYPFKDELFLSDHCNCEDVTIYECDVIRLPRVKFLGHWTRHPHSIMISSAVNNIWEGKIGDTLLVGEQPTPSQYMLKPVILAERVPQDLSELIKVQILKSRTRDHDCGDAAPNELVYTDDYDFIPRSAIERRCQIRFFTEDQARFDQIPHPYNKKGSGDFFYITQKQSGDLLQPLFQPWPTLMKQGWLPFDTERSRHLRGLDIFCGGGNFGRGLEDGGAVDFEWAVDHHNEAIHTYKANLRNAKRAKLFRGSVNDYLRQAMAGEGVGFVAQKGEVDLLSSGNPCQGFSLLNAQRGIHDRGLLNESLVASALSFIDFYRPKYALLENVLGIAHGAEDRNVLAQVLCVLVGMGYQVRTMIMDAWNFGSPQSRSRVLISCTAAGFEPLEEPSHTHSHPGWIKGNSLGKAANGLGIGCRYREPTPFEYVTAGDALKDLPTIDGQVCCIPFPDHRVSIQISTLDMIRLQSVPRFPFGMSFTRAAERGYMAQAQLNSFSWHNSIRVRNGSKSWKRIRKDALMPTVTTAPRPADGVAGHCLHWDQHRVLTIMEVRRAQGFPDDEVIIGEKTQQYKIVGNSVARQVAFALGISVRKAWYTTLEKAASTLSGEPEMNTSVMTPSVVIIDSELSSGEVVEDIPLNTTQVVVPLPSSIIAGNNLEIPQFSWKCPDLHSNLA